MVAAVVLTLVMVVAVATGHSIRRKARGSDVLYTVPLIDGWASRKPKSEYAFVYTYMPFSFRYFLISTDFFLIYLFFLFIGLCIFSFIHFVFFSSLFLLIIVFFLYIPTSLLFAVHLDFFSFIAGLYSQLYFAADYFIVLFYCNFFFITFLFLSFLSLTVIQYFFPLFFFSVLSDIYDHRRLIQNWNLIC